MKEYLDSVVDKLGISKDIEFARNFYEENQTEIKKIYDFVFDFLIEANDCIKTKSVLNYLALASRTYKNYSNIFIKNKANNFFKKYKKYENKQVSRKIIVDLILKYYNQDKFEIENTPGWSNKIIKFDDCIIGWNEESNGNIFGDIYYKNNKKDIDKIISECFWERFPNKKVILFENKNDDDLFNTADDYSSDDLILSNNTIKISNYIKKYLDNNYSRSILLYGPPGTGKTNIAKGIVKLLPLKTIRLEPSVLSTWSSCCRLVAFLNLIKPEAIIIDDIDHNHSSNILKTLEEINKIAKVFIVTANKINQLDDALIRPGRFDEIKQILHLDDEVLMKIVENDLEIFEKTKHLPIVCITEIMKRVKVLGKEEALKSISDIEQRFNKMNKDNYTL